jgi:hypothetical protein
VPKAESQQVDECFTIPHQRHQAQRRVENATEHSCPAVCGCRGPSASSRADQHNRECCTRERTDDSGEDEWRRVEKPSFDQILERVRG